MKKQFQDQTVEARGPSPRELKFDNAPARQSALARLLSEDIAITPVLAEVARCLNDEDQTIHCLAAIVLEKGGPAAVPFLVEAVQPHHPMSVRIAAVGALGRLQAAAASAVGVLSGCLGEADDLLRGSAALALRQISGPAIPSLASILCGGLPPAQIAAAETLGWIGPQARAVIADLKAVLDKASPDLALACCASLVKITRNTEEGLAALLQALQSPEPAVREMSVERLGELLELGKPAYPDVLSCLRDSSAQVRAAAALALVRIDPENDAPVETLMELLSDQDVKVRANAVIALGTLGPAARMAVSMLRGLERDRDGKLSGLATAALQRIGAGDD